MSEPLDACAEARDRYERAAWAMWANLGAVAEAMPPCLYGSLGEIARLEKDQIAEEQDRREWISGIKRRLGLITADEYEPDRYSRQ